MRILTIIITINQPQTIHLCHYGIDGANISPKALEILPKKKHSQKAVNTYCCNDLPDDMTNYFNY